MTRPAYYNEFDKNAAAWLRELIARDLIAPGDVDDRSIVDVRPSDLAGYGQCHFFAGIGVWSHALRRAGWADDRPIWTGSCPCQPFSAAGKGKGFDDERHLWPTFFDLIRQCRPDVVLGEQVASKDGLGWLDLVHADLEGADYAVGAVDTCAAGFGAPHIRQRLWWVGVAGGAGPGVGLADADDAGLEGWGLSAERAGERTAGARGVAGGLAQPHDAIGRPNVPAGDFGRGADAGWTQAAGDAALGRGSGGVAEPVCDGAEYGPEQGVGTQTEAHSGDGRVSRERLRLGQQGALHQLDPAHDTASGHDARAGSVHAQPARAGALDDDHGDGAGQAQPGVHGHEPGAYGSGVRPGPVNGFWEAADWLGCRDGRWRPVEPGSFPLAHGSAARVGRLRGYGNAIVAPAAEGFIRAVMEAVS